MTDVFISYKREERDRCVAIYNALLNLELSTWFDAHILPGTTFDREIEAALNDARAVLVLWSDQARDSDWIRAEARSAKADGKLVPIRLDDCSPPLEFNSIQSVDLFGIENFQSSDAWIKVVDRIGQLCGRSGLTGFVRCERRSNSDDWKAWLANFADDPLAGRAQSRLDALIAQNSAISEAVPVAAVKKVQQNRSAETKADPSSTVEVATVDQEGSAKDTGNSKASAFTINGKPWTAHEAVRIGGLVVVIAFVFIMLIFFSRQPVEYDDGDVVLIAAEEGARTGCAADQGNLAELYCLYPGLADRAAGLERRYESVAAQLSQTNQARLARTQSDFIARYPSCDTPVCLAAIFDEEDIALTNVEERFAEQSDTSPDLVEDEDPDAQSPSSDGSVEQQSADPGPPPPAFEGPLPSPPPPAVIECNSGPYIVFFDWRESEISQNALKILENAVGAYANCGSAKVMLSRYLSNDFDENNANLRLAVRRTASVRQVLVSLGIPAASISIGTVSRSSNDIETADGVRELQNRRVEISFGPDGG